jgi:hypothetical protein
MDSFHTTQALMYVDALPTLAGLTGDPLSYRWSSARAHADGVIDVLVDPKFTPRHLFNDWRSALASRVKASAVQTILAATKRSEYCGDLRFSSLPPRGGRDEKRDKIKGPAQRPAPCVTS